ncbi:bifunctional diaminohydroxyphosphoribosylaminopyrimidine deaminase/5-amino-6-(5-phosphoribosylamino)uracil reductase RibD [Fundidesulfovibrio butyratiphilus]
MAKAVSLARQGRGGACPNPCVGAVLVRDGKIVAQGWHQVCGGPHAEVNCLADAAAKGVDPAGATLYVTLEPCNHHGKTPPCTQALLAAKVAEVVVGCADPNPDVAGGGCLTLTNAGVKVRVGVLEQVCRDLIADFRVWRFTDRTYNVLKLASTLDGRIAAPGGRPGWISGPESRRYVHHMRSVADAVLVGGATLRTDNPRLNVRLDEHPEPENADASPTDAPAGPGCSLGAGAPIRQPLAVAVTTRLPEPNGPLALVRERPQETILWTTPAQAASPTAMALTERGVRVWGLPPLGARLDLRAGFVRLREEAGCHATLCEGGGALGLALLEQGLVDEFVLFLAPKVLGDARGVPLFSGRLADSMEDCLSLRLAETAMSGNDLRLTYRLLEERP